MNVARPERSVTSWWLGNISNIFAFTPMLWSAVPPILTARWLLLSITGLLLMNSGWAKNCASLLVWASVRSAANRVVAALMFPCRTC